MQHHHRVIPVEYDYPVHKNLLWLKTNAEAIAKYLEKLFGTRDILLIARGTSGILIASRVSECLGEKPIIALVRKPNEKAHSGFWVSEETTKRPTVVIDDFISTGDTMREIARQVDSVVFSVRVDAVCARSSNDNVPMLESIFPHLKHIIS